MEETITDAMLDKMINNLSSDDNYSEVQELKQKIFRLENYIKILENANDIAQELNKALREENERLRFEK